jgi:DNA-binding protein H-NS
MRFRRRNPRDVPFAICANPRKSGRFTRAELKALRRRQYRSWEDPVGSYQAADDIALDRLMRHHRKSKRNCNPRGRSRRVKVSRSSKRWWHGLGRGGRKRVAGLALGKLNPKRRYGSLKARQWSKYQAASNRSARALKRGHGRRAKSHKADADYWGWGDRRGRNPKLDGSPTRGEKRRVKYVEYLRSIAAKGEEARGHIATLTGELTKPGVEIHKPIGKRAVSRAVKSHTAEWEKKHAAELAPASEAAPVVIERPEVLNIKSRLHDLDLLHEDYKKQLTELGESDQNEAEIEYIHEEIAKLAKGKKQLRESLAAADVGGAQTNPRRRGSRRRGRRANAGRIRRASSRAHSAIRSLRKLLHQARTYLRSRR